MRPPRLVPLLLGLVLASSVVGADDASWVEPMKKVRARFTGKPGTLALFGDSITVSMAFWTPLRYEPRGMSEKLAQDL